MRPISLLYVAAFVFYGFLVIHGIGEYQLEYFDESRRGVSALEMVQGKSHPLVPTYAGEPEHWGTKPPLLIWLQTLFVWLLGPGEFAIRLPSPLATLAAIGLMTWFTARHWKNGLIGLLAGGMLLANDNFLGNHGARSGDFDALLLLFTLGQALFFYHWTRTGRTRHLLLAAGSLVLAGWTKGIAGCLLLPGIGLWTLVDATARKQLLNWRLYVAFGTALLGIFSYYLMREMVDPGYLQLVWNNELGGRYLEANEGHGQRWYHYFLVLWQDVQFLPFAVLGVAGGVVLSLRQRPEPVVLLCLIVFVTFFVVISTSATKLFWYLHPALPYLCLVAALVVVRGLHRIQSALPSPSRRRLFPLLSALLILLIMGLPWYSQIRKVLHAETYVGMQGTLHYKDAIKDGALPTPFTVLPWHYHPNARFYVEREKMKGRDVDILPVKRIIPPFVSDTIPPTFPEAGTRVMLCENKTWVWMAENYDYVEIAERSPCKIVEIKGPRN